MKNFKEFGTNVLAIVSWTLMAMVIFVFVIGYVIIVAPWVSMMTMMTGVKFRVAYRLGVTELMIWIRRISKDFKPKES